jgi:uncharacterized membrane protein YjjP (DUF1212 family)
MTSEDLMIKEVTELLEKTMPALLQIVAKPARIAKAIASISQKYVEAKIRERKE